jgi:hypothetical protein
MDYGEWLDSAGRWDWWFTGTFEYDATLGTARRAVNKFTREFDPDRAAWAIESRDRWSSKHRGSNVHVHGLVEVGEDSSLRPSDPESWWEARWGWAAVKRFEPDNGAGFYVAKYATKDLHRDHTSWDLYRGGGGEPGDSVPF